MDSRRNLSPNGGRNDKNTFNIPNIKNTVEIIPNPNTILLTKLCCNVFLFSHWTMGGNQLSKFLTVMLCNDLIFSINNLLIDGSKIFEFRNKYGSAIRRVK